MARYTMRPNMPDGPGFRITTGRRTVGSVRQTGPTRWVARLGNHFGEGVTAIVAFYEAVARQCGFADHAALQAHNASIRRRNNAARTRARATLRGFMQDTGISRPRPVAAPGPVDDEPFSG